MTSCTRLQLPSIDTKCRTASIATSIESGALRDRFWDAFQLDTGEPSDAVTEKDGDAHGPSSYRGLSAIERLSHLASALYPISEPVWESTEVVQPIDTSLELLKPSAAFESAEGAFVNGSHVSAVPASAPGIITRFDWSDALTLQCESAIEAESDTAVAWTRKPDSEQPWACLIVNDLTNNDASLLSSPGTPIFHEDYIQDFDKKIWHLLLGDAKDVQSEQYAEGGMSGEILSRPKSPKIGWFLQEGYHQHDENRGLPAYEYDPWAAFDDDAVLSRLGLSFCRNPIY